MNRKLFLLNGLAILAVVCNHAAGWGITAMFWWTHRYRDVIVPNYDQLGSSGYWLLVLLKQLTVFSVPTFLFVSGAFMAYASHRNSAQLTWKMIRSRIQNLLVPYFIWSLVYLIWEALQEGFLSPWVYIKRLLLGQAVGAFFFVPLLVQCLLLSPFLVKWAQKYPVRLLFGSIILQVVALIFHYLGSLGFLSGIDWNNFYWLFANWIFFFTSGIVVAQHQHQVEKYLVRFRWLILTVLILSSAAAVVEPEWLAQSTGIEAWRGTALTFSTTLYSILVVLTYLAFEHLELPFPKLLFSLGCKSYGIYLIHLLFLELTARSIYHIVPYILSVQFLLQPLLVCIGVAGPYLLIALWVKTPLRAYGKYLFG